MAADGFRSSGGAADSYLGSLISLTSKSEIRYEGILFNINTDEASIGLRNVRSYGTEGRRKDGPQVPAIDKVYEYIVFRGSDIKDLQVKSSPPAQPAPSVHNDPAIIQSHFTPPTAPSSLHTASTASAQAQAQAQAQSQAQAQAKAQAHSHAQAQAQAGGSLSDFGNQIPQPGIPRTAYHNITPLYQPGANLASWNPPPPPTSNNGGLSVPMYWPGYYGPSASVQSQQQSLIQPVQGLPMQPSLQPSLAHQSINHPNMNPSYPTGVSNISASQSLEFPPPLLQPIVNSSISTSSTVHPVHSSALTAAPSNMMPSKPPAQAVPTVSQSTTPPLVSSALSNMLEKSTVPTLIPNQPKSISSSSVHFNNLSESLSSVGGTSSSPALVTPGQFLHPGPTISPTPQIAQKDVEVVQVPLLGSSPQPLAGVPVTAAPVPVSKETQAPLLPLPSPVNSKMNGVSSHTRYANRGGRGRGRGNEFSRAVPNYTEDFDFEAMNERFKKDEVWGHLGKSIISQTDDGLNLQDEDNVDPLAADKKPVYKKDDFFDTLSCNALDRESRNGRPRFSEQMRLDTETFGDFSRNRGFRGGRGPGRGGRSRGGYHGRGYGYGGRGRGQNVYRAI